MNTKQLDELQSVIDWHGRLSYDAITGIIENVVGHQVIALAPGKGVSRDETAALILAIPDLIAAARKALEAPKDLHAAIVQANARHAKWRQYNMRDLGLPDPCGEDCYDCEVLRRVRDLGVSP